MAAGKPWSFTNKATIGSDDRLPYVQAPGEADSDDVYITGTQLLEHLAGELGAYFDAVGAADAAYSAAVAASAPAAHVGAGSTAHAAATTSVAGFLSAADKTKLDGIATGATVDDVIEVLTPVSSPSSPWTVPNGTGSRFVQATASGALTVNKTTDGFTSGQLQVFIVRYVASGGDITITHGSGISVGQGVAISTIPDGTYRDIIYQTRDGGTSVYYDGDPVLYSQVDMPLTGQITDDQEVADPCPYAEWIVPARYNGWKVKSARVEQSTAGTTNASTYMPFRVRSGTPTDLCTGNISVASAGTGAAGTVQTSGSADVLATGDRIRVEIVSLSTTKPKGGTVMLEISNA